MQSAIEQYEANRLLNSNPEELAVYFAQRYEAEAPIIDEARISVGQGETKVDVTNSFEYGGWAGERTVIPGTRVTLHIPYTGDQQLLAYKASTFNYNHPRATLEEGELLLTYDAPHAAIGSAKEYFEAELNNLRQHLSWTQNDVQDFNSKLPQDTRAAIDSRRTRLLESQSLVAS